MKWLWLFRLGVLIVLTVLFARPVITRPDPSLSSKWAVLIDSSRSMNINDPDSRFKNATSLASKIGKHISSVLLFKFADDLSPLRLEEVSSLAAKGVKTQIGLVLQKLFKTTDIRGVILLSDGRNVGAGDPVSAAAVGSKPILCVGLGNRTTFKDAAVRRIQSPPFAFKNIPMSLSATVSAVGYPRKNMVVKLLEGKRLLQMQTVPIVDTEYETTVNFSWTPENLGTKHLRVQVSPMGEEVTVANNHKEVTLDVGRDRFRVLYICGLPGHEYNFLRYQFKSDPAVELVTFVILRNAGNLLPIPENELSLIPFPTEDVLINQMASFDLVVLEDFSFWEIGLSSRFLQAVRKRVDDGGSFLLIGSARIYGSASPYGLPGIEEMLPMDIRHASIDINGPLKFMVTNPSHPILRLEANPNRNKELWSSLPPLEDITAGPTVKTGAQVLGAVSYEGKQIPVLTVWKHGKGRVGMLNTRTTWRFSMVPGANSQGAFVYQQLWKNMVLWLTHADEYKTVRVAVEGRFMRLGESAAIRVWVYDEYFKPLPDAEVRLHMTGPENREKILPVNIETTGVFSSVFIPDALGDYSIRAWVTRRGQKYGDDIHRFRVIESQFEEEDLRPDFNLLKEIADVSGGRFVTIDQFSLNMLDEFDREIAKKSGRKVLLWNSPLFFGTLILLLGAEWILRKSRGLP